MLPTTLLKNKEGILNMARDANGDEYTVSNPHPGYLKDPNIKNEMGHTEYPKWIVNQDGERVIAETPAQEKEILGEVEVEFINEDKADPSKNNWTGGK